LLYPLVDHSPELLIPEFLLEVLFIYTPPSFSYMLNGINAKVMRAISTSFLS
jgi:hypothetical protein